MYRVIHTNKERLMWAPAPDVIRHLNIRLTLSDGRIVMIPTRQLTVRRGEACYSSAKDMTVYHDVLDHHPTDQEIAERAAKLEGSRIGMYDADTLLSEVTNIKWRHEVRRVWE